MERRGWKRTAAYVGLLSATFVVAVVASEELGAPLNNAAYDFMFRLYQPRPWQTQSVLLSIDETTINSVPGGMHGIRKPLAKALELVAAAKPKAVAVDLILADQNEDPEVDRTLARAFCATPHLVLSAELIRDGTEWEYPRKEFRDCATEIGHVHAQPDQGDSRTREIPLVRRNDPGHDPRYALSLQAFALSRGQEIVLPSNSNDVEVGRTIIPVEGSPMHRRGETNQEERRRMRIRFIPTGTDAAGNRLMAPLERISLKQLLDRPALAQAFADKVVFVGVIAPTAEIRDRLLTPVSPDIYVSGIEINAQAFETMAQGLFITDAWVGWVWLFSLALAAAAGLVFRYLPGWPAYVSAVAILLIAQLGLPWHGQGLMTEAVDVVNDFWFDDLGFPVLRAPKAIANVASRRISESNGMRVIAVEERPFVSGSFLSEIWEITAEEWRARRIPRR